MDHHGIIATECTGNSLDSHSRIKEGTIGELR
jgi:hypothetical protein